MESCRYGYTVPDRGVENGLRPDFDALRPDRLEALAAMVGMPKLARAARVLRGLARDAPGFEEV